MSYFINFLTIFRILAARFIFILLMYPSGYLLALSLFLISSLTDYFDGYLARKYSLESELGAILDPIADKILILFVLIAISINLSSYFIGFLSSIIIMREIWVSALRDFNARNNNADKTKVTFLAKIKTSIQLLTILIYLVGLFINSMLVLIIGDIFLVLSTIITLYTGYIYTIQSVEKNL